MTRRYETPAAFRDALEARLRKQARVTASDVSRVRRLLIFDRFLARIIAEFQNAAVLKGGVAIELRSTLARSTIDVDLRVIGRPEDLLPRFPFIHSLRILLKVTMRTHHPDLAKTHGSKTFRISRCLRRWNRFARISSAKRYRPPSNSGEHTNCPFISTYPAAYL